jgi:surface antigen
MKYLLFAALLISGCASQLPVKTASLTDIDKVNEILEGGSEDLPVTWVGDYGKTTVTPVRTFKIDNEDCRDYEMTIQRNTRKYTACRDDNGKWHNK